MIHVPRRLARLAFYAVAAAVATLSLMPGTALPPASIGDKAGHVVAYAGLGVLGAATARGAGGALLTLLGLATLGATLELLQTFSPGRSPELADALVNIAGACLGGGAVVLLRRQARLAPDPEAD
jgi:VanZ family protein